jgi:flagellar basal-body rod protein FlgF
MLRCLIYITHSMISRSLKAMMIISLMIPNFCFGNNGYYISLSNHIARKTQFNIVANNTANTNTNGFENDSLVFKNIDKTQSSKKKNSFVRAARVYMDHTQGPLKHTGRNLDLAVGTKGGYFKVLTSKGDRYTLEGACFIDSDYTLVNKEGHPFANRDNAPITIPENVREVIVSENGTIFADQQEIDTIGVFTFPESNKLVKEGNNLYASKIDGIVPDEFVVISGVLRGSNVSSVKAMAEMVELQRSINYSNNLMSQFSDLEKSAISKIAK